MEISRKLAIKKWDEQFDKSIDATDFAGRKIQKGAFGQLTSTYGWTLTYLLPRSAGGTEEAENLICVHVKTALEKEQKFPSFNANDVKYKLTNEGGAWEIIPSSDDDAIAEQNAKREKALELWKLTFGDVDVSTDFAGRTVRRDAYGSGREGAWKVAPYVESKPTENKNAYIANTFTIAEAIGKTAFRSNGKFFTLTKENGVYTFNDSQHKPIAIEQSTVDSDSTFDIVEIIDEDEINDENSDSVSEENVIEELADTSSKEDAEENTVDASSEEDTEVETVDTSPEEDTEEEAVDTSSEKDAEENTVDASSEEGAEEKAVDISSEDDTEEEAVDASLEEKIVEEKQEEHTEKTEDTPEEKIEKEPAKGKSKEKTLAFPEYVSERLDKIITYYNTPSSPDTWLDFIVIHTLFPEGSLPETASALTESLSLIIKEAAGDFITYDVSELAEESGKRNTVLTYRFTSPTTKDIERLFNTCMLLNTYAPLLIKKFGLKTFKVYNFASTFETSRISYPSVSLAEFNIAFKTFMTTVFGNTEFYDGEAPLTLYLSEAVVHNVPSLREIYGEDAVYRTDARLIEHNYVFGEIKARLDSLNNV